MKIVLPVHHFPPRYSAGAELYTLRLARWLLAHGHEAEVVCVERTDDAAAQPLAAWRDEYQAVPVWRLALNLAQAPDPFAWSYNNPAIGSWFAGYLADTQPDIVHLQSGYLVTASVLAAARARGCPTIVTLHDFWFVCPRITLLRGDGRVCAGPPADPGQCAWCRR
jgi:glycosyltransferase involved in cell wall biosynthesis